MNYPRLPAQGGTPRDTARAVNHLLGKQESQQAAITDLGLAVSDPPTQAEVQAVSDKADAILAALRAYGIIAA